MSVFIISEAGINHNGDFNEAKKQIKASQEAGADAVKFQKYDPIATLGADSPYLELATRCQFTWEQLEELSVYARSLGIRFGVSIFDSNDIPRADRLVDFHKVASRMNRDTPFIHALLGCNKPTYMSVQRVPSLFYAGVGYMYCLTKYPSLVSDMAGIPVGPKVGLSSHCPSIAPSLFAVAHGSKVLENHTTFSRELPGCDQSSSITYSELEQMVKLVREVEKLA